MTTFADKLVAHFAENARQTRPFIFQMGQVVRITKFRYDDGQTPRFWEGAKVTVVERVGGKTHWYWLRHENGSEDKFSEEELDMRFARKDFTTG